MTPDNDPLFITELPNYSEQNLIVMLKRISEELYDRDFKKSNIQTREEPEKE